MTERQGWVPVTARYPRRGAGMTELASAGMTELASAGMTELASVGMTERVAGMTERVAGMTGKGAVQAWPRGGRLAAR